MYESYLRYVLYHMILSLFIIQSNLQMQKYRLFYISINHHNKYYNNNTTI